MCLIVTWRNICDHCEADTRQRGQKKIEYYVCPFAEHAAGMTGRRAFRACGLSPEREIRKYAGRIEAFANRCAYPAGKIW